MNESKQIYRFRLKKDMRPFIGMIDYTQRCRWEAISNAKPAGEDPEDYYKKCFARKLILGIYNSVLVVGTAGILFGLAKLVFE
jgi:hypothetical protein